MFKYDKYNNNDINNNFGKSTSKLNKKLSKDNLF
jgi:hypothetical protein